MKITVIGTGYVGLVSGACLAEIGHDVTCIDIDEAKLERLRQGVMPIYEQGLEGIVQRNVAANRLHFTSSYEEGMRDARAVMIAVGTPPKEDGSADMRFIDQACDALAPHLSDHMVVIVKSTVPVGTNDRVLEKLRGLSSANFHTVSNPEMLREGVAVKDFLYPSRIILGTRSAEATTCLQELYAAIDCPKLVMSPRSAELVKYANNSFLATKISFINDTAHLADTLGANIEDVAAGIGTDPRIGHAFLSPGPGWGGSCFPKDVHAILRLAEEHQIQLNVCKAAIEANDEARSWVVERLRKHLGDLSGKRIGVLGISFKQNTDDVRESPALDLIQRLSEAGAVIIAYDPAAVIPKNIAQNFTRASEMYAVAEEADAVLIATEWDVFRTIEPTRLASKMKGKLLFDARHLLDPKKVEDAGLIYQGVGRIKKDIR
jgi:UDPglucose 6-dehydrogenase